MKYKNILGKLSLSLLTIVFFSSFSFASEIVEGRHYKLLPKSQQITKNSKEIEEFFFYGCPHCFRLRPTVHKLIAQLDKSVKYDDIPAVFPNERWKKMAKVYYTLKAMKKLDVAHEKVFNAIHVDKKNLFDDRKLFSFIESIGVERNKFEKLYSSFLVDSQLRTSEKIIKTYGVDGVPTFVVNGRYVTSLGMAARNKDFLIEIINYLTEQQS